MEEYAEGAEWVGEYPPESAMWCNEHGCAIDLVGWDEDGKPLWRVVAKPTEYGPPLEPDPAPTREELAAGVAELADMMAAQSATNDEVMAALAEIGDAVAALAGEE